MAIAINGSGTITGISIGGIPDGVVDTDVLANNAVTFGKIGTTEQGQLCKAWVNFNGTGTVAIRASYNVSSITDNGTGDYTVNFTTAMSDANYCAVSSSRTSSGTAVGCMSPVTYNTGSVRVFASGEISSGGLNYVGANFNIDHNICNVAIFR